MTLILTLAAGLFDILTGIAGLDLLFGHDGAEARKPRRPVRVARRRI